MPKVQWTDLPDAIRQHLLLRLKERQITEEDLYQLKLWRESEPIAPDGLWKTFLLRGQPAKGEKVP